MAAQVRHWKEASSLILASKKSMQQLTQTVASNNKSDHLNLKKSDYSLLAMQRSSKSKFFPNAVVFPGGVTDKCDFSPQWTKVFGKRGILSESFDRLQAEHRPPMYTEGEFVNHVTDHSLPAEVGYRINAIRETFEETGVLIAKSDGIDDTTFFSKVTESIPACELKTWRKRVANDASCFLDFCLKHKLYPDVFSLKEWSNWLTPISEQAFKEYKLKKRYDTIFYVVCLDDQPVSSNDENEAQHVTWYTPDDILKLFYSSNVILGPPQLYEFSRLLQIPKFDDLKKYLIQRESKGVERWSVVNFNALDGVLSALIGDDNYPEKPNLIDGTVILLDETLEENRKRTKNHNRMEIKGIYDLKCYNNCKMNFDQIQPIQIH